MVDTRAQLTPLRECVRLAPRVRGLLLAKDLPGHFLTDLPLALVSHGPTMGGPSLSGRASWLSGGLIWTLFLEPWSAICPSPVEHRNRGSTGDAFLTPFCCLEAPCGLIWTYPELSKLPLLGGLVAVFRNPGFANSRLRGVKLCPSCWRELTLLTPFQDTALAETVRIIRKLPTKYKSQTVLHGVATSATAAGAAGWAALAIAAAAASEKPRCSGC